MNAELIALPELIAIQKELEQFSDAFQISIERLPEDYVGLMQEEAKCQQFGLRLLTTWTVRHKH